LSRASGRSRFPRIVPFGDAAVLILLGDRIEPETNRRVHRLARAAASLAEAERAFGQPVPGYASVLVPINPLRLEIDRAIDRLAPLVDSLASVGPGEAGKLVEVPTRYGGENGPDLEEVAARHDLSRSQVIELHASVEYRVYMLGFAPGFAYLGRLPKAIATPRRATPRTSVPAGSVGIADDQTGIYPFETPGGWQLIGRTELRLWDVDHEPAALLAPGDRVRFIPSP
jgi:KipI family sensor histidine kinase inhibitor